MMDPAIQFFAIDTWDASALQTVTVAAEFGTDWFFVSTPEGWSLPCGQIQEETPEAAALHLLRDQAGITRCTLSPVYQYQISKQKGMLFFAKVEAFDPLPTCQKTAAVPEPLVQPELQIPLFTRAQWFLNWQTSADELWDIYDADRKLTGRTHRRGEPLPNGDYHIVVHAWLQNLQGDYLLTRRAPNKGYPGRWECTGGSALVGDDSLSAVLREIREETGLIADPAQGKVLLTIRQDGHFLDLWNFRQDFCLEDVHLLPGETTDAKFVTLEQLLAMRESGELVPYDYFDNLLPHLT